MFLTVLLGALGLGVAYKIYGVIVKQTVSDEKVASIGNQIHIGAMAFMRREYTCLLYTSPSPRDRG